MFFLSVAAQNDDNQEDLRLNPEIESMEEEPLDYSTYPFIKFNNNKINLNGDDWSILVEKFKAAGEGKGTFNVVYLGDSHIQADFGGRVLRSRLAKASKDAGRGIIIPFKLAGTNQPNDYHISLSGQYTASKLMRMPWPTEMTFTGIGIRPDDDKYTLTFGSDHPAKRLTFHTRGELPEPLSVRADNIDVGFITGFDDNNLLYIELNDAASEFSIDFNATKPTIIGGIELSVDSVGSKVHSIGNNGATFSSYATLDLFGSGLASLSPDLVIVALGTNEAFGRTTAVAIQNDADVLISTIKAHCPGCKVLLIGPTECYRRTYRRRKGRRSATTVVNTKTADMARAIRLYAEVENIPYYNHYAVAGSASKMKSAGILSRDGVHFTAKGYRLWGNLLSDALLKELIQ